MTPVSTATPRDDAVERPDATAAHPLFVDRLRQHAREQPDALALRALGGERSFASTVAQAERIAGRLREAGCRPGDRVMVIGRPGLSWLDVMLGSVFARCTFAPLSAALTPTEQAQLIADATPRLVFAGHEFLAACPCAEDTKVDLDRLDDWIAAGEGMGEPAQPQPDDVFSIIYSSGTTGVPKGIAHSTGARTEFAAVRPRAGAGHVTLLSTSLYTNFGFLGIVGPLYHGGAVSVMPKFNVEGFLDAVRDQAVTDLSLVPVQVRRLLEHPGFDPSALATLTFTMISGSPLDPAMKARLCELWPGRIVDSYGTTETGGIATLDFKADRAALDTVGRLMPGVEIVTLSDDLEPLPAGEIGEIAALTPLPMEGYYNRDALTHSSVWTDRSGRRFFRTGDVGRLGADGYLRITGRAKDVIISGGLNIYACDIEAAIDAHEAVHESAVIAIPDARWGECPYAIVVRQEGATATADDILGWLDGRLARTSRPVGVEFVDELPRNDLGKVLKRVLREPFWSGRDIAVA